MELQDWQQRVVEEKHELDAKLVKLDMFLDGSKPSYIEQIDWDLLKQQRTAMGQYSFILDLRIGKFKGAN